MPTPTTQRMQTRPIVIAHRGASGYRPEHSLAAYRLAIAMGADCIETDLVITRDGVLVARHENELSGSTDVAGHPEFAARRTTRQVDGVTLQGWFSEDFTLAELKTLRCREPLPVLRPQNTLYDGRYQIVTLDEILDLLAQCQAHSRRRVTVNIETKHPSYFAARGLALEPALIAALEARGLRGPDAPICLQSFEVAHLRELRRLSDLPIIQLVDEAGQPYDFALGGSPRRYADLLTAAGLAEIAAYAQGIGPSKNQVIPRDRAGYLLTPTSLVDDAHRAGLFVHAWTFRNEQSFLPANLQRGDAPAGYGNAFAEYASFLGAGLDGLISDNPDTALEALAGYLEPIDSQ